MSDFRTNLFPLARHNCVLRIALFSSKRIESAPTAPVLGRIASALTFVLALVSLQCLMIPSMVSAAVPIEARQACPTLSRTVDGVLITPGMLVEPDSSKRPATASAMVLTPLEFSTVGQFRIRAPAVVIQPSLRCDSGGRTTWAEFRFFWTLHRITKGAVERNVREDPSSLVSVKARFYPPGENPIWSPLDLLAWERANSAAYSAGVRMAKGLVAYSMRRKNNPSDYWDAFALDEIRDAAGRMPVVLCNVKRTDFEANVYGRSYLECRVGWNFNSRFSALIDFHPKLIREAPQLLLSIHQEMTSYIVWR